jgi:hypothetical protein
MAFINFMHEVEVEIEVEKEIEVTVKDAAGTDLTIAVEDCGSYAELNIELEETVGGIDPDNVNFTASVSNTPANLQSDDIMDSSSGEMDSDGDAHVEVELTDWANQALELYEVGKQAVEETFNAIKDIPYIKNIIDADKNIAVAKAVREARAEVGNEAKAQVPQFWIDFCTADFGNRPAFGYPKKSDIDSIAARVNVLQSTGQHSCVSDHISTTATHTYRTVAALAAMNNIGYCSQRMNPEVFAAILSTYNGFLYGTSDVNVKDDIAANPYGEQSPSIYHAVMLLRDAAVAVAWIDQGRPLTLWKDTTSIPHGDEFGVA